MGGDCGINETYGCRRGQHLNCLPGPWSAHDKGRAVMLSMLLALSGCTGHPEGVQPVSGFELERYLGTWHEIARLDHSSSAA